MAHLTRREFDEHQRELTRQIGVLAADVHRTWWRPLRNRRLRQEIWRLHGEAEQEYAAYMTRDDAGRLVFRVPTDRDVL